MPSKPVLRLNICLLFTKQISHISNENWIDMRGRHTIQLSPLCLLLRYRFSPLPERAFFCVFILERGGSRRAKGRCRGSRVIEMLKADHLAILNGKHMHPVAFEKPVRWPYRPDRMAQRNHLVAFGNQFARYK